MNLTQTNTERPTSNTEHRRELARALWHSAFGVRCSVFGVRSPSGSWALSSSKRNRWLPMNQYCLCRDFDYFQGLD